MVPVCSSADCLISCAPCFFPAWPFCGCNRRRVAHGISPVQWPWGVDQCGQAGQGVETGHAV